MRNKERELGHDDLIEIGRKWLSNFSPVVLTEISGCSEEPDVFGLDANIKHRDNSVISEIHYGSTLIECKTTRADFLNDSKKLFRECPERGIAKYRYYLTPKGLLKPEEIPEGWGLLETTGKRVKKIKLPIAFYNYNLKNEMNIIISAFRRLRIPEGNHCSIRAYTHETKNRASITIDKE